MKTLLAGLALVGLIFLVMTTVRAQSEDRILEPKVYQEKLAAKGGVLVDVRTPNEYKEAHLADATLINYHGKTFKKQILALPKDKTYFIYCRSGGRSGKTLKMMTVAGFDVYDMKGGILAWQNEKLPVEKGFDTK